MSCQSNQNIKTERVPDGLITENGCDDDVWTKVIPLQIINRFRLAQQWQSVSMIPIENDISVWLFADEFCEYAFIPRIIGKNGSSSVYLHTYQKSAEYLAKVGHSVTNMVRTWIYLRDIDGAYPAFNQQRDTFYRENKIFEKRVPASTAIGKPQNCAADMVLYVLAVRPLIKEVFVRAVPSPMQCSAMEYKVSFNRAVEIETTAYRRLIISGTASIDSHGNTVFEGDVKNQAAQTFDVIDALLKSRDMSVQNLNRVLGYTKRKDDLALGESCMKQWAPHVDNCINVHGDICRSNLLFEIEAEALLRF